MSDLNRRDFLKASAAGIAVVGTSGLLVPTMARAQSDDEVKLQCNAPYAPERVEENPYYIVCPSDSPEQDRQYSALVHVTYNGTQRVEDAVMEGVDYYPFDGSYWEESNPLSETDYYLCRSICVNGYGDTPEFGAPTQVFSSMKDLTAQRIVIPKAPQAVVREKVPNNAVRIRVEGKVGAPPAGATLHKVRLSLIAADANGKPMRPVTKKLPPDPKPNVPTYGRQTKSNYKVIYEGDPGDDFNDNPRPDEMHSLNRGIYYFHTEVIYDFGKDDKGRIIRRGSSSWLKVDMSNPTHEQDEVRPPK